MFIFGFIIIITKSGFFEFRVRPISNVFSNVCVKDFNMKFSENMKYFWIFEIFEKYLKYFWNMKIL